MLRRPWGAVPAWGRGCGRSSRRISAARARGVVLLRQAQWQGEGGANAHGILRGCRVVSRVLAELLPTAPHLEPPVSAPLPGVNAGPPDAPAGSCGVHYRDQLSQQASAAIAALDSASPSAVVTAGGDCSVDLAPCGWLAHRHDGDLAVLYVDAHADLNNSEESPSGHFHGMVLRALLGDAPHGLTPVKAVEPSSVVYAGLRELDPPEAAAVRRLGITALPPEGLRHAAATQLQNALLRTQRGRLHIHLDLDVLDPSEFPHVSVPSPGGLSVDELRLLLRKARDALPLAGLTVTEARPLSGSDESTVAAVLHELLGTQGLDLASSFARPTQGQ